MKYNNEKFGMHLRLDWNSNLWLEKPNESDLNKINFEFVKENQTTYTYYNLNQNELVKNGFKYALAPQLTTKKPIEKVAICFYVSNYKSEDYIVGYVLDPDFNHRTTFHGFPSNILFNLRSDPSNFISLVPIKMDLENYLPSGKQIGTQGFNYLTKNNCIDLIKLIHQNRISKKLINIISN